MLSEEEKDCKLSAFEKWFENNKEKTFFDYTDRKFFLISFMKKIIKKRKKLVSFSDYNKEQISCFVYEEKQERKKTNILFIVVLLGLLGVTVIGGFLILLFKSKTKKF